MNYLKKYVLFVILLIISQTAILKAQEEAADEVFKYEVEVLLKEELESREYLSDLEVQIISDTFRIEKLLSMKLSYDSSTFGMVNAIYEAESEYDKLLNKYYKLLLNKLNDADKEILKQSQRNWIKFRDSERALNELLCEEEYSGGGTMQGIIIADKYLSLTKNRALELCEYLKGVEGEGGV